MDVSDRTVAQRMSLPDWCFGDREIISVYLTNNDIGTRKWGISEIALPDPACIWEFAYTWMPNATGSGWVRAGLADTVPTTQAQMDATDPILPYFGSASEVPPVICPPSFQTQYVSFNCRKGMVTGGKKLVIEIRCGAADTKIVLWVMVSTLPIIIPAWLVHDKV